MLCKICNNFNNNNKNTVCKLCILENVKMYIRKVSKNSKVQKPIDVYRNNYIKNKK
jgi:hypothetical protein